MRRAPRTLALAVAALVLAPTSAYAARQSDPGPAVTSSGELTLRVAHVALVRQAVEQLVTGVDGRVAEAETEAASGRLVGARLSLEVPRERFGAVMTTLAGLGVVEDRQQTAEDLGAQLVELEQELALQDATVTRIEALAQHAGTSTGTTTEPGSVAGTITTARASADSTRRALGAARARTRSAHVELRLTDGTPRAPRVVEEDPPSSVGRRVALGLGLLVALAGVGCLGRLSGRSAPARRR